MSAHRTPARGERVRQRPRAARGIARVHRRRRRRRAPGRRRRRAHHAAGDRRAAERDQPERPRCVARDRADAAGRAGRDRRGRRRRERRHPGGADPGASPTRSWPRSWSSSRRDMATKVAEKDAQAAGEARGSDSECRDALRSLRSSRCRAPAVRGVAASAALDGERAATYNRAMIDLRPFRALHYDPDGRRAISPT